MPQRTTPPPQADEAKASPRTYQKIRPQEEGRPRKPSLPQAPGDPNPGKSGFGTCFEHPAPGARATGAPASHTAGSAVTVVAAIRGSRRGLRAGPEGPARTAEPDPGHRALARAGQRGQGRRRGLEGDSTLSSAKSEATPDTSRSRRAPPAATYSVPREPEQPAPTRPPGALT